MRKISTAESIVWVMLLTLLLSGAPARAFVQQPTGSVEGTITDPQGSLIAGVTVTISQEASGFERSATTSGNGFFRFDQLTPGRYTVTASSEGFKKSVVSDVTIEVGQSTPLDVQLTAGGITETVEIQGGEATIDRTDNTVDGVVGTVQIANLPLNGRNFLDLARLQPGAETVDGAGFDPTKANYTGVSIGGQAGRSTQISVDGGSVVDNVVGTTTQNFSQEIIEEFQVGISNQDLSSGASATGTINVVTKAGSNEFHGNGYLYYRDDQFSAYPSLARLTDADATDAIIPVQARRIQFDREQFGGTIGGPIVNDKLFFFFNLEYNNQDAVSLFQIPNSQVVGFNGFGPRPFNQLLVTGRGDWTISDKHRLFGRYSHDDNDEQLQYQANGIVPRESASGIFSSNDQFQTNRADGVLIGLTSAISSKVVNDFRYSYNDFDNRIDPSPESTPGLGEIRVWNDGEQIWRSGTNWLTPQATSQVRSQIRDDVSWAIGEHTLRTGIDYERTAVSVFVQLFYPWRIRIFGPADAGGPAILATEEDFLNAPVRDFSFGVGEFRTPSEHPDSPTISNRYQFYVTDTWKLHPRFTANYGIAYRYDTNLYNVDIARPAILAPIYGTTAPPENDTNNWAPRAGFAWDILGDAKTVVRGGAGLYYDTIIDNLRLYESGYWLPPGNGFSLPVGPQVRSALLPGDDHDGRFEPDPDSEEGYITLRDALALVDSVRADYEARAFDPRFPTQAEALGSVDDLTILNGFEIPYSIHYAIGVQRELPWNMILQADFNYRKGLHEIISYDANQANAVDRAGNSVARIPDFGNVIVAESGAFSIYKALLMRVDKRFTDNWQMTASYALSRLESFGADGLGLSDGLINSFDRRGDLGPAGLDRTHRFVFSALYEFPRYTGDSALAKGFLDGWSASVISQHFSGVPLSVLLPGDVDLEGDADQGVTQSYLPGTRNGSLGREISSIEELNGLISAYNNNLASFAARINDDGQPVDPLGTVLVPLALLPADSYLSGDSIHSTDLRVTKRFYWGETKHLDLIAEGFNIFNVANLKGITNFANLPTQQELDDFNAENYNGASFFEANAILRPTNRQSGVFGTGGPRAFQFAVKFVF